LIDADFRAFPRRDVRQTRAVDVVESGRRRSSADLTVTSVHMTRLVGELTCYLPFVTAFVISGTELL